MLISSVFFSSTISSPLQTYREVGEHGYDFQKQMWQQALSKCVEPSKSGVLAVVLAEDYGGATEFLSKQGYSTLSVFVNRSQKPFLKREKSGLTWTEKGTAMECDDVGTDLKYVFGVRSLEAEEGGEGVSAGVKGKSKEDEEDKSGEEAGGNDDSPLRNSGPNDTKRGVYRTPEAIASRTRSRAAKSQSAA